MHTMVGKVFYFLGILLASTLLFLFVFGAPGRMAMWNGMNPSFQQAWRSQTFNDGRDLKGLLDTEFNNITNVAD